jgi:hypothetical protein
MQILLGETANGDVARTTFSQDYDPLVTGEEPWEGAPAYRMRLSVKPESKGSVYGEIRLVVEKERLVPLYAEFISDGGKLLKVARYKDIENLGGKNIARTLEIRDGLNPNRYTVMRYVKIVAKALPASYYNKEYLSRFAPSSLE